MFINNPFDAKPMERRSNRQSGQSLIELVVTIGLMAIIGVGLSRFMNDSSTTAARSTSKAEAEKTNKTVLDLLKRDVRYSTSYSLLSGGFGIQIDRRQLYSSASTNSTYRVIYRTECVAPSGDPNLIKFIKSHFDSAASYEFSKVSTQCLKNFNCQSGKFPRVFIEVQGSGSRIPIYTQVTFPDLLNSNKKVTAVSGAIGTALCLNSSGPKIRAVLESVYPTVTSETLNAVKVVNEEILLSQSEFSGLEILPNK